MKGKVALRPTRTDKKFINQPQKRKRRMRGALKKANVTRIGVDKCRKRSLYVNEAGKRKEEAGKGGGGGEVECQSKCSKPPPRNGRGKIMK